MYSLRQDASKMLKQRKAYCLQHLAAEQHAICKWVQEHWDSPCHMPRWEVALPSVEDEDNVFFDLDEEVPSDVLDVGSAGHKEVLGLKLHWKVPIHQYFVKYPADTLEVLLWSVLKNAIGKDLTQNMLLVHFNELSSMLQCMAEDMEHHLPMSTCFFEPSNYVFFGKVDFKSNFWGIFYELLPRDWKKVITAITDLIVGNPTIKHYSDMVVKNHTTGDVGHLTFKPNRWLRTTWELSGTWDYHLSAKRMERWSVGSEVANEDPSVHPCLNFSIIPLLQHPQALEVGPATHQALAIQIYAICSDPESYAAGAGATLPPTDCHLQQDQRAMEYGLYYQASQEKYHLKVKQLEVHKAKEDQSQKVLSEAPKKDHAQIKKAFEHRLQWFERAVDLDTGEGYWQYMHKYWKDRLQALEPRKSSLKLWGQVPFIF
ncbi:hypothetical protein L0F63_000347 [Massospora cicadina]|nr:hypothetical protein L0F63_000347 [Massospora cicadina]